jgi:hypothetical protein
VTCTRVPVDRWSAPHVVDDVCYSPQAPCTRRDKDDRPWVSRSGWSLEIALRSAPVRYVTSCQLLQRLEMVKPDRTIPLEYGRIGRGTSDHIFSRGAPYALLIHQHTYYLSALELKAITLPQPRMALLPNTNTLPPMLNADQTSWHHGSIPEYKAYLRISMQSNCQSQKHRPLSIPTSPNLGGRLRWVKKSVG